MMAQERADLVRLVAVVNGESALARLFLAPTERAFILLRFHHLLVFNDPDAEFLSQSSF